jgi:hypothetical protein
MKRSLSILIVLIVTAILVGCGGGGGGGGDEVAGEDVSGLSAIGDSSSASNAVLDVEIAVEKGIIGALADRYGDNGNGSYNGNPYIPGAVVTGGVGHYVDVPCGSEGSGCTYTWNNTSLTIVFDHFKTSAGMNGELTLTGTVTYTDDTFRSASLNKGGIKVEGSGVAYTKVMYREDSSKWGYNDIISFSASGDYQALSGTLTPQNGAPYNF